MLKNQPSPVFPAEYLRKIWWKMWSRQRSHYDVLHNLQARTKQSVSVQQGNRNERTYAYTIGRFFKCHPVWLAFFLNLSHAFYPMNWQHVYRVKVSDREEQLEAWRRHGAKQGATAASDCQSRSILSHMSSLSSTNVIALLFYCTSCLFLVRAKAGLGVFLTKTIAVWKSVSREI